MINKNIKKILASSEIQQIDELNLNLGHQRLNLKFL